jgi:restriction system protein
MKNYFRIMLGSKSKYFDECYKGSFIATGFIGDINLSGKLPENWRDFNKEFIPKYLERHPDKSKVAAGLSCGFLYTISKYIRIGDIVLCPNGSGTYVVGEVSGDYEYVPGETLQHRRNVKWLSVTIDRSQMTEAMQRSTGSIGTVSDITKYAEEIERFLQGESAPKIFSTDETIEDPSEFALEKHLEDFLVKNWKQTELGKDYDIFEEEGELVGQQYQTDTGPIDVLAISKDKKTILVVELKKGRASDNVVGQIMRYMGYVAEELADANQSVNGVIIALEDDLRIKRAISMTNNIDFYKYQISFKLIKS